MNSRGAPTPTHILEYNRTVYFVDTRKGPSNVFVGNIHHFLNDFAATFYAVQRILKPKGKQRCVNMTNHFTGPIQIKVLTKFFSYVVGRTQL